MKLNANPINLWLLLDDRAGNRSQCLGVADALAIPGLKKELAYSPWAKLPNRLLGASFAGLSGACKRDITGPWPDLVLAAGRRTAPVARKIKQLSKGHAKLVQIMWPQDHSVDDFDLICVPNHDAVPDLPNVFRMTGAPSSVNTTNSPPAGPELTTHIDALPSPRIALLCGGSTKNRQFSDAMAIGLGRSASAMANGCGGALLITTSRRSGAAATTLVQHVDAPAHLHQWDDAGENPYRAYLSRADAFIVTGESISMCSEACSTGKPVYIYAPDGLITEKHNRFHQELYKMGYARPLSGVYEPWTYSPLNAARQIADEIRRRIPLAIG
ncbi:MAG: mitochondrial fission ELM1 family protein [Rhodospirillales bacterium]|nr:mitochondrial fission ELM1 family protein [Rhodospirillales bacterium]